MGCTVGAAHSWSASPRSCRTPSPSSTRPRPPSRPCGKPPACRPACIARSPGRSARWPWPTHLVSSLRGPPGRAEPQLEGGHSRWSPGSESPISAWSTSCVVCGRGHKSWHMSWHMSSVCVCVCVCVLVRVWWAALQQTCEHNRLELIVRHRLLQRPDQAARPDVPASRVRRPGLDRA